MDRKEFWSLIEAARRRAIDDPTELAEELYKSLTTHEAKEIVSFQDHFDGCMDEAYTWDMWAAGYIAHGGCSDDMFEYFRAWVVSLGREVFTSAQNDVESLVTFFGRSTNPGEGYFCEEMLYAPARAYETVTGDAIPLRSHAEPQEPAGRQWKEESVDLQQRYPRLFTRFQYLFAGAPPGPSPTDQSMTKKPWWKFWR